MLQRFSSGWTRFVAVSVAAALGGGLGALHSYHADTTILLEMRVKSSVPSIAQVFFDVGRGFNETDSRALPVAGADAFQTLDFPLPDEPIRNLRFDPLTGPGSLIVQKMEVLDGAHRVIAFLPPERLIPFQDTHVLPLGRGALVEAPLGARDPITIVPLSRMIETNVDAYTDASEWGLFWLVVAGGLAMVATLPRVRALLASPAREVLAFLSSDPAARPDKLDHRGHLIPMAVLTLLFAAHILRAPQLFVDPRFWGEEGTTWFQYTINHSPFAALLFVFRGGYILAFTNVSVVLSSFWASAFGLEYAPLVTTVCAMLAQLLCFAVILWGKSRLLDVWWKRILACLIILCSPAATGEIWLNTINSQCYLGLAAFLLLFQDPGAWTPRARWITRALLLLCGLTGVYAAVLFPLFLLCFLFYRTREYLYQGAILAMCFLAQAGSVFLMRLNQGPDPSRNSHVSIDAALINVFFAQVATPCLGAPRARFLFHWLGMDSALAAAASVDSTQTLWLAGWFSILVMTLALTIVCRPLTRVKAMLVCGFVVYATLTTLTSLRGGPPSGRYAYLPGTILLLLLLTAAASAPALWVKLGAILALTLSLSYGISAFRQDPCLSPAAWGAPSWLHEVAAWHHITDYQLRVWPSFWAAKIDYPHRASALTR